MKKRRIDKKLLYVVLSVIIVSVLSLTLAYAVLSSNLTISGSTEVSGSSWNISVSKFNYLGSLGFTDTEIEYIANMYGYNYFYNGVSTGTAELVKEPTISGTSLSGSQFSLTKPDDAVVLYYAVTNNGTIPAKYESIVQNTHNFSSSTNNAADIELVSNNWYSAVDLYSSTDFSMDNILEVGYILCPGETIYLEFGAIFYSSVTSVPSSDITVSNLGGTINFVQADKSSCS